jgi:hypothetical protein
MGMHKCIKDQSMSIVIVELMLVIVMVVIQHHVWINGGQSRGSGLT